MKTLITALLLLFSTLAQAAAPTLNVGTLRNGSANYALSSSAGSYTLSGSNSGDVTIGTANGLSVAGQALSLGVASAGVAGALSGSDWSLFNGKESVLTFNAPLSRSTNAISCLVASGSQAGCLSTSDWSTFNNKEPAITAGTTAQYLRGDKSLATLNTAAVPESGNLYYTDARVRAADLTGLSTATQGVPSAANSILVAIGKLAANWLNLCYSDNTQWCWHDDFTAVNNGGETNWGGGNASDPGPVDLGHTGIVQISTGTTTTGAGYIYKDSHYVVGGGALSCEGLSRIPTLSDGTQTYIARIGLSNDWTGVEPTTGAWLEYTHSVNSGNWRVGRATNTVATFDTSSIAVASGTWFKWNWDAVADGSSITLKVDGVTAATVTTNIPAANIARRMVPHVTIIKSAGTTARTILTDYVRCKQVFTTPR